MGNIYNLIQNQEGISKIIPSSISENPYGIKYGLSRELKVYNYPYTSGNLTQRIIEDFTVDFYKEISPEDSWNNDEEEEFYIGQEVQLITDEYEDDNWIEDEIYFVTDLDGDMSYIQEFNTHSDEGIWVDNNEITGDY